MGFQSSFNQALGIFAGAALGKKHIEGQKESLAEQKMQGKFNVEREVSREQEQQNGTAYNDKNEMMAERAGQALASETNSKKSTSEATRKRNREEWIRGYKEWYRISYPKEDNEYNEESNTAGGPIIPDMRIELIRREGGKK